MIECDEENGGVFMSYDEKNIQLIKCLIIGSANTPYAYGVFLFDLVLNYACTNDTFIRCTIMLENCNYQ